MVVSPFFIGFESPTSISAGTLQIAPGWRILLRAFRHVVSSIAIGDLQDAGEGWSIRHQGPAQTKLMDEWMNWWRLVGSLHHWSYLKNQQHSTLHGMDFVWSGCSLGTWELMQTVYFVWIEDIILPLRNMQAHRIRTGQMHSAVDSKHARLPTR